MRILFQSPLPPFRGGIAQFGSRLLLEMEELGADVLPVNFSRLYPHCLFPGKTQLEEGRTYPDGILHGYDPVMWIRARRVLRNLKPDVVLTQWWHPFFAPCFLAGAPGGIPSAAICHNIVPHESVPLAKTLSKKFLKKQKLLAVHSKPAADNARLLGPSVLQLFHPVYDQYLDTGLPRAEARKELGLEEKHTALLFFGLVREYKGFDILIEACDSLPENYRIIAAGENYTGKDYSSERLAWENSFIPDSRVGTWFNAADIVVLPYREASQSGIAQIALAFGKPMVATPVGGLPETIEEGRTGTIAADSSPEALAAAIEKCARFALEEKTAKAVKAKAAEFSWKVYASRLLEALE